MKFRVNYNIAGPNFTLHQFKQSMMILNDQGNFFPHIFLQNEKSIDFKGSWS